MPTNYDNEQRIIDEIHELERSSCLILSDDFESVNYQRTAQVLETIFAEDYLCRWKDNSKSQLPPDFINEIDSIMMEVMRIDDHSADGRNNPVLKREKEMHKEMESMMHLFPNAKNVFCNPVTDLPTEEDHNYKFYYSSFQRTVRKHSSKIEKYRMNHPDKKLIFLVMDETSGVYFEAFDEKTSLGRLHLPFFDNRFLNEFIDKDIDYLIFYSPFNYFETFQHHDELPHLVIFDVKHLKNSKMMKFIDYDESKMKSCEL